MGLLNVTHNQVTQSLLDLQSDLLKNPFYLFNDKKALPVDYYNINTNKSTLDEALKIPYANLGQDSPLRFNYIKDFYLYGLERIALNLENGDFGIESSEITGEAIILPDTIIPYPGDFFSIIMLKHKYLFRVMGVDRDTLDNGGNYWKINYKLEYNDDERLLPLVVDEYQFISGNVGSNFASILKKTKWDVCSQLDDAAVTLKKYYKSLFYNNKVQTYTFIYLYDMCPMNMNSAYFYDPYLMEFIIKNKVLANTGDGYDYIDHKTNLRPEFPIKYNRSIWRVIETRDKTNISACKHRSAARYIDDASTIFSTRYENYFELSYDDPDPLSESFAHPIDIIDPQLIGRILNNQLYPTDSNCARYNMIIKYFNYEPIGVEDILPFDRIVETESTQKNYFMMPVIIFIMESYIKELMANINNTKTS